VFVPADSNSHLHRQQTCSGVAVRDSSFEQLGGGGEWKFEKPPFVVTLHSVFDSVIPRCDVCTEKRLAMWP